MNAATHRVRDWALRHLARPRPAQDFVPQIDGLRCVAIVAVVLFHMEGYVAHALGQTRPDTFLHHLLRQGNFGVPLFFALSGYIIACPFFGPKPPKLGAYFLRRITRLEPPYIFNMLLIFALKVAVSGMAVAALFPHLLVSLLYQHGLVYGEHSLVNGVAWSLEVEWQFYLLAPLLFALVLRLRPAWRGAGLWLLILAGGLAHQFADGLPHRLALTLLHYFGFFVAGVWVATCEARWPRGQGHKAHDGLGLCAGLVIVWVLMRQPGWQFTLPAMTGLLVFAALRGPVLRLILGWWPVHCIGAMCYTLYLYHFFVVSLVGRALRRFPGWPQDADHAMLLMATCGLPVVIAACIAPYLLIERPFMVWRPGRNRLRDAFRQRVTA